MKIILSALNLLLMTFSLLQGAGAPTAELVRNFQPLSVRGVNYYPREIPWGGMWTKTPPEVWERDMQVAASLGINSVRTFLTFSSSMVPLGLLQEDGTPTRDYLQKMDAFLAAGWKHGIRSILCFEFSPNWLAETNPQAHWRQGMSAVVTAHKNDGRVLLWDLMNEPEDDAKWTDGTRAYLRAALPYVKQLDPNHLTTVGLTWRIDRLASIGLPDVLQYHEYSPKALLFELGTKRVSEDIANQRKVGGARPLLIGEFGMNTARDPKYGAEESLLPKLQEHPGTEAEQARLYEIVLSGTEKERVAGALVWCLHDYPIKNSNEAHFGLIRADGSLKPAAVLLRETFTRWKSDASHQPSTTYAAKSSNNPRKLAIETSNPKLERAFNWAIGKALSYVQTGKTGPVDGHERNRAGKGSVKYIPSYWAGYTWRTAFYSRDFCHQAPGAHLLGLQEENLSVLRAFAISATAGRKWYPLWALNFDGSPFKLDYGGDNSFVREVPAVFELVEQCYRQYLWTGNPVYLHDPALTNFCLKAVTEFIALHDTRITNGVAEGDGSGNIFRGSATYNEIRSPLIEAGDGIACEYQALLAYSRLLAARGEREPAAVFEEKAEQIKTFFNTQWGVKRDSELYVRGYDVRGELLTDFGLENSWFMPMKFITEPSPKTDAYLDFVAKSVDSPKGRPSNLEAISYLPGVFFPYNRVEEGWKWLEYIIDQSNREYPEISYTLISHVVEGLLGLEPNAPEKTFLTVSHLPRTISQVKVLNIPLGDHRIDIAHEGATKSNVNHTSGTQRLKWQACFYGDHPTVTVNGNKLSATPIFIHGVRASFVTVEIRPGQSAAAEVLP